jgi:hypothetical protein
MATYRSSAAGVNFVPYERPEGAAIGQEFVLPITKAVANGDVFILGKLPPQSTLLALSVDVPTLDTGTNSATLTAVLGDSEDNDAFLAAGSSTFHNTDVRINSFVADGEDGKVRGTIAGALPKIYTNAADIRLTVTGAASSAASTGTIKGFYVYSTRPRYQQPVR